MLTGAGGQRRWWRSSAALKTSAVFSESSRCSFQNSERVLTCDKNCAAELQICQVESFFLWCKKLFREINLSAVFLHFLKHLKSKDETLSDCPWLQVLCCQSQNLFVVVFLSVKPLGTITEERCHCGEVLSLQIQKDGDSRGQHVNKQDVMTEIAYQSRWSELWWSVRRALSRP